MNRQQQVELLQRLLHYVETKTTALADAPWRNEVSVYSDPNHLAREQTLLFRQRPLLMGFASEWANAGSYRTDDYAGVPILIARGRDGILRAFLNVCRHRGAKVACLSVPITPGPMILPAASGASRTSAVFRRSAPSAPG
jgi:hypothetical protein